VCARQETDRNDYREGQRPHPPKPPWADCSDDQAIPAMQAEAQ
jgi:hypothetical protein